MYGCIDVVMYHSIAAFPDCIVVWLYCCITVLQ